ncbi:hypothetical protein [Pelagicoccus enzymogenes]|nr:hypothetical protein [Pelagicoccus enzymogenes]MDQ8196803.1 hypothetical protein [Pelagicoccus enzymogenes]
MSDLTIFIIGILVCFLCLGGVLIHNVVNENIAEVDETADDEKD